MAPNGERAGKADRDRIPFPAGCYSGAKLGREIRMSGA